MAAGDFLTLAGHSLACIQGSAKERPPFRLGKRRRGQMANFLSTERSPKREFSVQVLFPTTSDATTVEADISVTGNPGIPKAVTATSAADGLTRGATLTVFAVFGDLEPTQYGGDEETPAGMYWMTTLTMEEG